MILQDLIIGFVWVVANGLLAKATWLVATRMFPQDSRPVRALHALILAWAWIAVACFCLSLCRQLSGLNAVLVVGLTSAVGIWRWSAKQNTSVSPAKSVGRRAASLTGGRWIATGWSLLATLLAVRLVTVLISTPFPQNWDTITYHLPFVSFWEQTGSLHTPQAMKWFFPGNGELLGFWMTAAFSGDFLAPLANIPVCLVLVLATLNLCRQLRFPKEMQHLTAMAAMANNIVWHQLGSNKNDMAVTCLFVASAYYLLRLSGRRSSTTYWMMGISLGLMFGVKYYSVPYTALLLAVFVAGGWIRHGRRYVVGALPGLAVCLVIFGGFWYIRNAVVSGLPLYPKGLPWKPGAEGANENLAHTTLLGNGDSNVPALWEEALWAMTGPVNFTAYLLSACALAVLIIAGATNFRRPTRRGLAVRELSVGMLFLGATLLYLVTPFAVEWQQGTLQFVKQGYVCIRLGNNAIFLSVVATGYLLIKIFQVGRASLTGSLVQFYRSRAWWLFLVPVVLCVAYQICFIERYPQGQVEQLPEHWLIIFGLGVQVWFSGAFAIWAARQRGLLELSARFPFATVVAFCLVVGLPVIGLTSQRWHAGFDSFYEGYFESRIFHKIREERFQGRELCVIGSRSFPFIGSQRQGRVHQMFQMPALPLKYRSTDDLVSFLTDHRIDFLIWESNHRLIDNFDLDQLPVDQEITAVRRIWSDERYEIFEVERRS